MNETTRKKLNPTQSIINALPSLIEAFVTFYGESERERITTKFNNMIVIGYSNAGSISSIIRNSNKEKSKELFNEFFSKLTSNEDEIEKLNQLFFNQNDDFEYYGSHPIYQYIKYKETPNVTDYFKQQIVNFLKQIHPETTIDNLDELIQNGTFKSIETIVPLYLEILDKYKLYQQEIKPYSDYVDKCNTLKSELNKKYTKLLAEELKDLFTEEEYRQIEGKTRDKYFYSIHDINAKTKNYTAYNLNGTPLIDAFSQENEEILQNGKSWRKDSIKRDRIEYFKNFGLDLGDDYDSYLNNQRTKELIPSQELIMRIKHTHKKLYTKMMNQYYTSLPEYQENITKIASAGLLEKDHGYNANAYETRKTAICTNLKQVNGKYVEYPLFLFNIGHTEEYLDSAIIHELNHAYELTLKSVNGNKIEFCCGWDVLCGELGQEQQDVVSLEERKEKRNYELFNEIVNELIAQEISEILSQGEQYIFNTKEDKKITGGTSYEHTKFIIKHFYETYKKEIIESRRTSNIEILYDAIGKENLEEFNQLFHEYYENFNIGLGMLTVYQDLQQGKETELTKKLKDLVARRNNILIKMEEHNQSRKQSL